MGNPLAVDAAITLRGLLNKAVDLTSIWRFDDQLTAPLHGFANAEDYYARCSSGPKLKSISARTLLIQSADDPFISPEALPLPEDLGSGTELQLSDRGGHVGFIARGNRAMARAANRALPIKLGLGLSWLKMPAIPAIEPRQPIR